MAAATDTTLRKARRLVRCGNNPAAVDLYLSVLDRFPGNRRAQAGLSEATRLTDPDAATRLNQAVRTAKTLLSQGQGDAALHRLRDLRARFPHLPELHNELGTVCFALSMPDEAQVCFRTAHRLNPRHPDFASNYATMLGADGKEDAAIAIFQAVLDNHPAHLAARRGLGRARLGLGQCDMAIRAFDAVLSAQPMDADIHADRQPPISRSGLTTPPWPIFAAPTALIRPGPNSCACIAT